MTKLFQDEFETVRVERWAPWSDIEVDSNGGAEILILEGTTVWIKSGHLIGR